MTWKIRIPLALALIFVSFVFGSLHHARLAKLKPSASQIDWSKVIYPVHVIGCNCSEDPEGVERVISKYVPDGGTIVLEGQFDFRQRSPHWRSNLRIEGGRPNLIHTSCRRGLFEIAGDAENLWFVGLHFDCEEDGLDR